MKKFKVNVKVPVRVAWKAELVEDDANFFMRLTPRVMTGGGDDTPRLKIQKKGNIVKYMTTQHYVYNMAMLKAAEEAKKKAIKAVKEDVKKAVIDGAKAAPKKPGKTFVPRTVLSSEDFELGSKIGR